jgi:tryptophan-rich hypothetical protein
MTRLERTKWTSTQERSGWRHFEVIEVRGTGTETQVTLCSTVERSVKIVVPLPELLNPRHFRHGWLSLPLPGEPNSMN